MYPQAFQTWQREREAIEVEMDRLAAACRTGSPNERQIRRIQFETLVQRREAADRSLLRSDRAVWAPNNVPSV